MSLLRGREVRGVSWIVAGDYIPLVNLAVALDCSQSFGAPMAGTFLCFGTIAFALV